MTLLQAQELDALERLALATRSRQIGFFTGDHRSRRFGTSVDFADHREYRPGDDFRRIDAALSARMDKLFLKLFEAEEDLSARIVIDLSSSMTFGDPAKDRQARKLAAAFVHLALIQHDRARVYVCGGDGVSTSRWWRGRAAINEAMSWIESAPAGGAADLHAVLRAVREEGRKGILIVLTDLLFDDWEQVPRLASTLGEAALVQVLSPDEMEPSLEGDVTLVDDETGAEVPLAADATTLGAYRERVRAFLDSSRAACARRGMAYAFARSDDAIMDLFMRAFRTEAVVR